MVQWNMSVASTRQGTSWKCLLTVLLLCFQNLEAWLWHPPLLSLFCQVSDIEMTRCKSFNDSLLLCRQLGYFEVLFLQASHTMLQAQVLWGSVGDPSISWEVRNAYIVPRYTSAVCSYNYNIEKYFQVPIMWWRSILWKHCIQVSSEQESCS